MDGSSATTATTMTTLEQVMTQAYNVRVADGTWDRHFAGLIDLEAQPFCTGASNAWPTPVEEEETDGSDLLRVLDKGVFTCGRVANVKHVSNDPAADTPLIETGNATTNAVTGLVAEFWDSVVAAASDAMGTQIQLEWQLFESSQATLDAVRDGTVDAACGGWVPDATYNLPPSDDDEGIVVSRGYAFCMQTCPIYLRQTYIYTSTANSWDDLLMAMENGDVTDICVTGGTGREASCQHMLDLLANLEQEDIKCTGYGSDAYAQFAAGACQAVWRGAPPQDDQAELLNEIVIPMIHAEVAFFRSQDLVIVDDDSAMTTTTTKTSLEVAVTHVYESLLDDGVWNELYGDMLGLEPTNYCKGQADHWPVTEEPTPDSDLSAVIDRGTFRW